MSEVIVGVNADGCQFLPHWSYCITLFMCSMVHIETYIIKYLLIVVRTI